MTSNVITYKCYECDIKRTFFPSPSGLKPEEDKNLQDYLQFDQTHHNHKGFILILKLKDFQDSVTLAKSLDDITSFKMIDDIEVHRHENDSSKVEPPASGPTG